jgi:hypothetical protein
MLSYENRRVIAALVLAAVMVAAPGCTAINPGDGGAGGASTGPALDSVPDTADVVAYVNVQEMRTDSTLRTLLETADQADDSAESPEEMLSDLESESGLDPAGVGQATMFGQFPNESAISDAGYFGMVVTADWTEDDVVTAVENGSEFDLESGQYAGATVYEPVGDDGNENAWLGVVENGTYVLGTEDAVKDSIDVDAGDSEAVSGTLRTTFEDTENTLFRFASSVPGEQVPQAGQTSAFEKATVVAGTMNTYDNETVELSATVTFSEESATTNAKNIVEGAVALSRSELQGNTSDLLADDHLWVGQDGTSMTVTTRNSVDDLVSALEDAGSTDTGMAMPLGLATSTAA